MDFPICQPEADLNPDDNKTHLAWLFAAEGGLLQFTTSLNSFGNNLYASNLGATDTQIGLVQTVPNVVAMIMLVSMGILADRAKNSRVVPLAMLLSTAVGYGLICAAPAAGSAGMLLFFLALVLTVGSPVVYNAQWQNFFGDVAMPEIRNALLTVRNRGMYFVGIAAPIACGLLMGRSSRSVGKLRVLQLFFVCCGIVTLIQAAVIARIPVPQRTERTEGMSLKGLVQAASRLIHHGAFLKFFLPVVIFYMGWQFDWSMWYIGEMQYLGMSQSFLPVYNGIFSLGQLVAVGFLSKAVRRKGADYTLCFAALGLMACPGIMVVCTMLPPAMRVPAFTVLATVLNAPQCAANLCIVQILLRVTPRELRNMAATLYTLTITLTNCFVPYLGVAIYTALGADYRALLLFNLITFLYRVFALALLMWRCREKA